MAATAPARPNANARKGSTMRPPPVPRPGINRAQTATPTLNGRTTPNDSNIARQKSPKRKAGDPIEAPGAEETNINVVVRCRGRNDRELRENSAVVVSSDGIKGSKVELSMGPNALSNKAYQFDKVFSPAADQEMIYEEVVAPVLDEVLAGFNCTIFAYGQTGTGKTFTMSGDISDTLPIPEAAGIIPRVLHDLFDKLNADENSKMETSVKCSFIELYNEELRDLLAVDDSTKLKIFDDANKNGRTTTLIQGMEETYIESASKGIRLLSEGSHKRQVAATRCNDLSSRSHTVFTMTIYHKRPSDAGDDYISASKLNLVDLAGSENIQRSGAENKRATEAGLINKSLLTLGRVINALVDRSSHIPYRESKLTRLLQDSLGGRTKTCIIATLSPAKSNLEETISTLDYAFRAKNIRNKPQMNQLMSKKTLLREFTTEIEKLKSELIATRHRNGYYLTADAYEELTTQSESRRILSEEQRDKIETMETNLRNKVQELFNLTTSIQSMKKDNEKVKLRLDSTRDLLDNTELVLGHAKRSLSEEVHLRKAYEETESKLSAAAQEMQSTLQTTTKHVHLLQEKVARTTALQHDNHVRWNEVETSITNTTAGVKLQIEQLGRQQSNMLHQLTARVTGFVQSELTNITKCQQSMSEQGQGLATTKSDLEQYNETARAEMNKVLEDVSALRDNAQTEVGKGLDTLTNVAGTINARIAEELGNLQTYLKASQETIQQQLELVFNEIADTAKKQNQQLTDLHHAHRQTQAKLLATVRESRTELADRVAIENAQVEEEQKDLLARIGDLITEASRSKKRRIEAHIEHANKRVKADEDELETAGRLHDSKVDAWLQQDLSATAQLDHQHKILDAALDSRWASMASQLGVISKTTKACHVDLTASVADQKVLMGSQLAALDDVVTRVRAHNDTHLAQQQDVTSTMLDTIQARNKDILQNYVQSTIRLSQFAKANEGDAESLRDTFQVTKDSQLNAAVDTIQSHMRDHALLEDVPTGATPARMQYVYPQNLPRTQPRDVIIDAMRAPVPREQQSPAKSPAKRSPRKRGVSPTKIPISPSKTQIFTDVSRSVLQPPPLMGTVLEIPSESTTLREMDTNIRPPTAEHELAEIEINILKDAPDLKTVAAANGRRAGARGDKQVKKTTRFPTAVLSEGRENAAPDAIKATSRPPAARRSLRNRSAD